jgi:hypothetical protein
MHLNFSKTVDSFGIVGIEHNVPIVNAVVAV